jgi:post-segregation antitoxin (ccd killing protein)
VYSVCMARLNVYLPDELAERAKIANLNISALTQAAIAAELQRQSTDSWLASLTTSTSSVDHDAVMVALDAARDELGADL